MSEGRCFLRMDRRERLGARVWNGGAGEPHAEDKFHGFGGQNAVTAVCSGGVEGLFSSARSSRKRLQDTLEASVLQVKRYQRCLVIRVRQWLEHLRLPRNKCLAYRCP